MPARRIRFLTLLSAVFVAAVVPNAGSATAASKASCANPSHPGGDWPMYGNDVGNSRNQDQEKFISPQRAPTLVPSWQFTAEGGQTFSGTPTVANGCVYLGSQSGWVFAVNADSGKLVWSKKIEGDPEVPALAGAGGINSTLTVANGLLYASVATYEHPYVAAMDPDTGKVEWATVIENQTGAGTHSSPIVAGDVLLVGWDTAGVEFDAEGRKTAYGGFSVMDADTGKLLKRTYTIPEKDRKKGYSGGNIWSSFAVDSASNYAYVGTAAPYSPAHEHERTNAILKVDIDRSRPTFGEIVDSYKGVPDNYSETTRQLPCVPLVPGSNFAEGTGPCQKLDLDFAAGPNIITLKGGKTVVGELQKAGVYHIVDAANMKPLHQVMVGNMAAGFAPSNIGTTAYDGSAIYGAGGSANSLFALDRNTADFNWLSATIDAPIKANPTTTANGVVYSTNGSGILTAHDARTGVLLLAAQVGAGTGSGVSVARNTVYVAGGGGVTALRPDPERESQVDTWKSILTSIPTPPTIPHVDRPPL